MIALTVRVVDEFRRIETAAEAATRRYLFKAAGYLGTVARQSIRRSGRPAAPGRPPHTQTGRLKNAIRFYVDRARQLALIGPTVDVVGIAGAEHEHGGRRRAEDFPPRPFMGPALQKTRPKLPELYRQSFK